MIPQAVSMAGPFPKRYAQSILPPKVTTPSPELEDILESTKRLCEISGHLRLNKELKRVKYNGLPALDTSGIQQYLHLTTVFENLPNYSTVVGTFTAKLISKSYASGVQQFTLDLRGIRALEIPGNHLDVENAEIVILGHLNSSWLNGARCHIYLESALHIPYLGAGSFSCKKLTRPWQGDEIYSSHVISKLEDGVIESHNFIHSQSHKIIELSYHTKPTWLVGDQKTYDWFIAANPIMIEPSEWEELWEPIKPKFERIYQLFGRD